VVESVREGVAVSTQEHNHWEGEISYHDTKNVELSKRFTVLGNLDDNKYVSRAWENIKVKDKIVAKRSLSYYELKEHKSWCEEEYS
jgi:hypothetical protein